jgi:hypothetical protein
LRLLAAFRQPPQFRCQSVEARLDLGGESLTEDFPMLGLSRSSVPGGTPFQLGDQIVLQIAHMQVSSHPSHHEIIEINDLK